MRIDILASIVCLAGLVTYALAPADHPKAAELGRLAFFVGLLVVLLHAGATKW